ncbi:MAG: S-layer homology domain-containing protein [Butyricicoccus sp.]|nr:S-layer homology domain-containing protein [Butyricicoccus sp.]
MAGNYNPGYGSNTAGYSQVHMNYTFAGAAVYGPGAQYTFGTTANYMDVTIPEDAAGSVSLTDGYIGVGVIGLTRFTDGGDSHRNIPDSGCSTRDSQSTWHTRSILPEITIDLAGAGGDQAAADQAAADAVEETIAAIGAVTLESETAIDEARTAYDALTDAQKALVENYETLTAAESALEDLKAAADDQVQEVEVTLSGLHDAQINNFELYTYTDGVKGTENLLADHERIEDGYSYKHVITLSEGDYWVEGYDANEDYNGGIVINVSEDSSSFQIHRMYQIYATNSGWAAGTDYSITLEISDADDNIRVAEMGTADNYGTVYTSCLFVVGDEVKATFTPIGERADSAAAVTAKKKPTYNDSLSAKIPQVFEMTITAPAGSTISAGTFEDYYVYNFVEPTVETTADGVTATFRMPELTPGSQGPYHFYRVQNPDGVTYWNFANWKASATIAVTEDDLYMNDGATFTKDTVIDDYSENIYDRADIYLNANHQGYLAMDKGEKHEWNVFRNWMAIESFYNAKVALPDVHYEVIELEGEDVVSIVPDANNSSVAVMEAKNEGTAIVLVTYDAMTHMQGQSSTSSKRFSAIWPECTGVVVVTVGNDGTSIDTNMLMDRVGEDNSVMDAEHDILFYLDDAGAEFTFTPEADCKVTINRSEIKNGKMTFDGFTNEGVNVAEDGSVTLTGLTTGRHIVKVEKDGKANYQVITARQISYVLQDANGDPLAEGDEIRAGDTIKIQFTGLVNPVEKMSGAYNFNARIYLEGSDGTTYSSTAGGTAGVYDFSGNPIRQNIKITLPKYWDGETYTLSGNIAMGGFANVSLGGHRGFNYEYGFAFRENSPAASLCVSRMPEITLNLAETTFVDGKLTFVDENGSSVARDNLTIEMTDGVGNKIIVAEDGSFPCVAGEYSYTIYGAGYRYKTGNFAIGADDVNVTKRITLELSSENAWDGKTQTEPQQDADGVYLIGTGAEMAWFAAQQDANKAAISGKLTADIDLAGYPWTMKASTSNYATVLDGDSHKIEDLNADVGLFSTLGSNSVIRNLTLYGKVESTTNAGSIVKYANGSNVLIENCVNYASVSGNRTVGGLVGYAYAAEIKNSVNHGTVSGDAYVGGISGSFAGATKITGCYNTGAITATADHVGGIFGGTGYAVTVKGCYNTGAVSGTNYVGGIGGELSGPYFGSNQAVLSDCYNIGTVTGTGSNVGGVVGAQAASKTSLARGYVLTDTAANNNIGIVLSADELKQAALDTELFGGTCTGYPALRWQTDVSFHTLGETAAETVEATCLTDGYAIYTCENCGKTAKGNIVNALGHSWCDEGEGAHTHSAEACETCKHCVYTVAICEVNANCVLTCTREDCSVTKTKDLGGALQHEYCTHTTAEESAECEHCAVTAATCMENGSVVRNCVRGNCENEKAAEVIPFTGHIAAGEADENGLYTCSVCNKVYETVMALDASDAQYAWTYNAEKQRFESTNQSKGNSTSTGTKTLTLAEAGIVSFKYGVSSEANYDKLTITAAAGDQTITIANSISGTKSSTFSQELAAGTYTLTASFVKDYSGNGNEDVGWISDICVTYGESVSADQIAADAVEAKIAAIGAVTLESETAIDEARAAYDALTDAQKALVENYETLTAAESALAALKAPAKDWKTVMNTTKALLLEQAEETAPVVDTYRGEWMVLGLARSGVSLNSDFFNGYYQNAVDFIKNNIDANGRLHPQASTENSRVIFALTAIGKDASNIEGYNLLRGLSHSGFVKNQGINGPIWALIAADTLDYEIPENADSSWQVTRDWLIEYILGKQLTNGGWSLDSTVPDDMTPMAIQALAPYYETNADVKTAVDKALTVMSGMLNSNADGGNTETNAQIVTALSAMGIDADTDSRFVKNGRSVLDALISYQLENGRFKHAPAGGADQMATEQAFYALVAYDRFKSGKTSLYDMSDLKGLYNIDVIEPAHGAIEVVSSAKAGDTVTVTVDPAAGYVLDKLYIGGVLTAVTDNKATFTMPSADVVISASFKLSANADSELAAAMAALTNDDVKDADKEAYERLRELEEAFDALPAAQQEALRATDAYKNFEAAAEKFAEELDDLKKAAEDDLDDLLADFDEDDYTEKNWKKIRNIYSDALDAIEDALYAEELEEILEDAEEDMEDIPTGGALEVTFRLIGDSKHDNGVTDHVEYVTWIETTEYTLEAGATVYDLFMEAIEDFDLNQKGAKSNYVESIQAPDCLGGYWLGEFDNGRNSGWMYTIDGKHPGTGLIYQKLEDGDEVIWHYVDDYTKEERNSSSSYYERWLEARDISPEEYVERIMDEIVTVGKHGTAKPALDIDDLGRDVTFTFIPDEGYVVEEVIVDGKSKGAVESYTYKDLSVDSRIEVTFMPAGQQTQRFTDVAPEAWYYDEVEYVAANGFFSGTGSGSTFSPYTNMSRAMMVTVLHNMANHPAAYGANIFSDVASGAWYDEAVRWATAQGITSGYPNGAFGVNDDVTREQIAVFLYKFAQSAGYDVSARASLTSFADDQNVSAYAETAMQWAVAEGIISGRTGNLLAAKSSASRAEVAAMICNFMENVAQ